MKLYKLLNDIILEESLIAASLLTENVSDDQIIDAINNKYNVNILYDDYPDAVPSVPPSKRYIQVHNFSDTKAGNKAIRAYQIFGGSKTTPGNGEWKIFRLDRIRAWLPTKMKFYRPMVKFNPNGDKSMSKVHNIATFKDMGPSKYVRKSTDITPEDIEKMSPDEKQKYYASIAKTKEKYTVKKPQSSYIPKKQPAKEPIVKKPVTKKPTTKQPITKKDIENK